MEIEIEFTVYEQVQNSVDMLLRIEQERVVIECEVLCAELIMAPLELVEHLIRVTLTEPGADQTHRTVGACHRTTAGG